MARGSVRANRRPYLCSSNLFSAKAVIFPFLLIVFLVSQDKSDQDFLLKVKDLCDQPISVPLDIENRASANRIRMRIIDYQGIPKECLQVDCPTCRCETGTIAIETASS